jgi:hypothetical protein
VRLSLDDPIVMTDPVAMAMIGALVTVALALIRANRPWGSACVPQQG